MPQNSLYRLNEKVPYTLTLIVMSSFASMGAIIFTPALVEIEHYFKIPAGYSQLTISLFLLGYAIGQLIYGPLANRYGRKPAFFIGIVIATVGSLLSILAMPLHSFGLLIIGRVLEALGSSAGLVIAFTIINDFYYPDQARRIIAYLMLAFAVVPGVSTCIGGVLVTHFHWISCFYFLLGYGLLLTIPASLLAETATTLNADALQFNQIKNSYIIAVKDSLLRKVTLFFGLSGTCVYVYAATNPLIAIHYLHISAEKYGVLGLIPYIGTALASIYTIKTSARITARTLMKRGLLINVIATLYMVAGFYFHFVSLGLLISSGFIFMVGNCFIMSGGASIATVNVANKADASAMMNFINLSLPMLGILVLALIPGSPLIKLPLTFLIVISTMVLLWVWFIKTIRR